MLRHNLVSILVFQSGNEPSTMVATTEWRNAIPGGLPILYVKHPKEEFTWYAAFRKAVQELEKCLPIWGV